MYMRTNLNRIIKSNIYITPKEPQVIASILGITKHDLLKENLK